MYATFKVIKTGYSWFFNKSESRCTQVHRIHFLDDHRLSSLYRGGILERKISLVKYSGRAREGWPSRMARCAIDAAREPAQAGTGRPPHDQTRERPFARPGADEHRRICCI